MRTRSPGSRTTLRVLNRLQTLYFHLQDTNPVPSSTNVEPLAFSIQCGYYHTIMSPRFSPSSGAC